MALWYAYHMTATAETVTSVSVFWSGSYYGEPTSTVFEQQHVFDHANAKSARRTAKARIRRWHNGAVIWAVLVNADEKAREETYKLAQLYADRGAYDEIYGDLDKV